MEEGFLLSSKTGMTSEPDFLGTLDLGVAIGEPEQPKAAHFAQVMRDIRRTGGLDSQYRSLAEIRRETCTPDTKAECWGCRDQICKVGIIQLK